MGNGEGMQQAERGRGRTKEREGVVVSSSMNKTAVVAVKRLVKHPVYGKFVRKTKKLYAHDETNQCQVGDVVRVRETRPLSKLKRWKVQEILVRAQ